MWASVVDTLAALVLLATAGVSGFGAASALTRAAAGVQAEALGTAVLASAVASVTEDSYIAYPTTSGYPTSGPTIPNPANYPVSIQVANYEAGQTPPFSPNYPNSGLQAVTVTVTLPSGATLQATIYKSA